MTILDRLEAARSRKVAWLWLLVFPVTMAGALLVIAGMLAYAASFSGYSIFVDAFLLSITLVFIGKALESFCMVWDWIGTRLKRHRSNG